MQGHGELPACHCTAGQAPGRTAARHPSSSPRSQRTLSLLRSVCCSKSVRRKDALIPHPPRHFPVPDNADELHTLLIQTYYTPFFAKIQVSSAKLRFFVDSYNFYVNFVMSTSRISEQKFLHICIISEISSKKARKRAKNVHRTNSCINWKRVNSIYLLRIFVHFNESAGIFYAGFSPFGPAQRAETRCRFPQLSASP